MESDFRAKANASLERGYHERPAEEGRCQHCDVSSCLLESETQTDILTPLKQNTADIQKILHQAKTICSDQGVDDDLPAKKF